MVFLSLARIAFLTVLHGLIVDLVGRPAVVDVPVNTPPLSDHRIQCAKDVSGGSWNPSSEFWAPGASECRFFRVATRNEPTGLAQVHKISKETALSSIGEGVDIVFVGDSLVRQLYWALISLYAGSDGHDVYGHQNVTLSFPSGPILRFIWAPKAADQIRIFGVMSGANMPNVVFAGGGVHDLFYEQSYDFEPLFSHLERLSDAGVGVAWKTISKLNPDAPKPLHGWKDEHNDAIRATNAKIGDRLNGLNFGVVDAYKLTEGMPQDTQDGIHYPGRVNLEMAQLAANLVPILLGKRRDVAVKPSRRHNHLYSHLVTAGFFSALIYLPRLTVED